MQQEKNKDSYKSYQPSFQQKHCKPEGSGMIYLKSWKGKLQPRILLASQMA